MEKNKLIIYEGAMCCSTGVCGPEPDQELIAFNETLKRLKNEYNGNLTIIRAGLLFNSLAFSANEEIKQLVKKYGSDILPITTINGRIVAKQRYPSHDELTSFLTDPKGSDLK
jgi:hypothetical protein